MRLPLARMIITLGVSFLPFSYLSSAYANGCSLSSLSGAWGYSEQGTHLTFTVPFSEVGWFRINSNGTGTGEAFLSVGSLQFPSAGTTNGVPLQITSAQVNPRNCMGTATFVATFGAGNTVPRTITFTIISSRELHFTSTTGDINGLGVAKKR